MKTTDKIVEIDALFEILPVGVWILSTAGLLIDINQKGLELMGAPDKESVKGLPIESSPNLPEIIKEAFRKRESVQTSFSYSFSKVQKLHYYETSKDCETVRVTFNGTPIFNSCGEFDKYIFTLEDITELYNKEQMLSKSQLNLSLALKTGDIVVWEYDVFSRCFSSIERQTQKNNTTLFEDRIAGIHPDDVDGFIAIFDKLLKEEISNATISFRFINTQTNEYEYIKTGMSSVFSEEGTIDRIIGVRRDITEEVLSKQKIEKALLKSLKDMTEINNLNESLSSLYNESQIILHSLPVGIAIYDKDGRQQYINDAFAQTFGVNDVESHMKKAINVFEDPIFSIEDLKRLRMGEDLDRIIEYDLQIANDADFFESMYKHKIYFEGKTRSIKDSNGNVIKYIMIVNDITEKRKSELILEDSERNLKLSLEAGDVDAWSYDLKTETFYHVGGDSFGTDSVKLDDDNTLVHPDDLKLRVDLMDDIICGKVNEGHIMIRIKSSANQNQYRNYETRMAAKKENGAVVAIACAQRDITEKLQAELVLEKSEQNLKLALDAGNVESWSYNVKTEIFYPLGDHSVFGEKPITLEDNNKLVHPDNIETRANMMNDIIQGKIKKGHIIMRFRSNIEEDKYRYYETRMIAQTENDVVVTIAITHKDITDDYLHEIEKEYNQKRVEFTINSAEMALWEYNVLKKEFALYNNAIIDLEPVNGLSIEDYTKSLNLYESSYIELNRLISAMNDSVDILNSVEIRIKPKSASTDEAEWRYYTIGCSTFEKDENGTVVKYVGYVKNNTKWITLNYNLAQLNTQLETVLDIGLIFPFICEMKNDKFYFSAPTRTGEANIFPLVLNTELTLEQVLMVFSQKSAENMEDIVMGIVMGNISEIHTEIKWSSESTNNQTYELNFSTIRDKDFKGSLKTIGYLQDVTERNQMISDLKEAKLEAEKIAKLKSSFLANMSHEIRTPLNAIVGFSELLIDEEDKGLKLEYLGIISTNNDLLLKLISDILDLSKIDAGLTDVNLSTFDFAQFFNELCLSMQQRIIDPTIVTLSVINLYSKCIVELDKNRLAQVCINYITNAIKYTPKGSIEMSYECINGGIRLYVKDTGIGIADNKKHKLFERFEKLDDFAQGTGIGLSITKALVESMKGEVGFESKEGSGSTFWAWIPCKFSIK